MKVFLILSIQYLLLATFSGSIAEAQETPVLCPRARTSYLASINYSFLDFPIPNKFGLTVGFVQNPFQTWEIEYMRGSWSAPGKFRSLGSVSDVRAGLIGRTYFGDSFHMSYGLSYFDFTASVGDALMSSISGGSFPSMDALVVTGYGLNVGIGNMWVLKYDIVLGIDWISWAQPLVITKRSSDYLDYTTNENDKRNVEDTIKTVSYLPRFSVLNVHVGMLF